ncbi:MAG TPA: acetamidase/formamidase family protein [Terriglobales bacterium]|jgi:acetamidase/formamidase|nr:acetamidase/formamidase family protein [Terriglobales bacterium]
MIATQRTLAAALLIAAAAVGEGAQAQIASEKGTTRESTGKHYVLPANKDTTQWGWLDPAEKPKLVVDSGDTVSIETLSHSMDEIKPGVSMEEIVSLRLANPGGGPHSVTGPIYVNGAEPGDTLEIRIKKIVMKESGFNFNLPGKQFPAVGLLANEFPEGHVQYFKLDTKTMTTEFKPGIVLQLKPFPGTIAVGPDPNEPKEKAGPPIHDTKGRTSTLRPWKNGSNMDVNEMQAGSTLYFPVFQKGGLIWTGDSHCLQGNGEVNLTALECSYKEIEIQPIVRKDLHIDWPRAETATSWIFMGFDEDLNEAMKIAVRETVKFLAEQKMVPMSREEAYSLTSIVGDCRVSQVVDIRKGVHCMIPKSIFTKK